MRVLVIGDELQRRQVLIEVVEAGGHDTCCASSRDEVAGMVRLGAPDALLLDVANWAKLREVVERARSAAGASLPVLAVLPEDSVWLRTAPSADLLPLVTIPGRGPLHAPVAEALERYRTTAGIAEGRRPAPYQIGALSFDAMTHELFGPRGPARLTPSESAILRLLAAEQPAVVPAERLARMLWGEQEADRHTRSAIRSHIYTLRRKFRAVGLPGEWVETLPGVGHRLRDPNARAAASAREQAVDEPVGG